MLFIIKSEFQKEDPIYRFINEVKVIKSSGEMVYVYDIHDAHEFWINKSKLQLV